MCKTQLLSNENQPTSEENDVADEKDSYLINFGWNID